MPAYRKKPVVIDAICLERVDNAIDWNALTAFFGSKSGDRIWQSHGQSISIYTLEGAMVADPGDWIIRGVAGEFYPCKPEIFAATYELA